MFNIFKRKKRSPVIEQLKSNPIFEMHNRYWTPAPKEKNYLLSKYPDKLNDKNRLRLLYRFSIDII